MIRILIVEDERPIANLIDWNLTSYGYSCQKVYDGLAAADLILENSYDLILLDIMLPGVDGYSLLEQIKPTGTPVIFLTAKGSVADRVQGLRAGADDYLVKPFEIVELLARVETVLRRVGKSKDRIQIGDVIIDESSMQVTKAGAPVALTKRNLICCCCLRGIKTWPSSGRAFMSGSGKRNTPVTAARWTSMSSGFARSWGGRIS